VEQSTAPDRQVLVLTALILVAAVANLPLASANVALPSIGLHFDASQTQLNLVAVCYSLGLATSVLWFGAVGDRYGRKAALIASNLLFGIFTLIAAYATDLTQMFWLRLIAGIGIGGVIPNAVAINAESAPRRLRAILAIIAVGFVPLGGAIPGFVTATLVPAHGWQILFLIGGIVPIVIAVAGIFGLPESIKFMALHERYRARMREVVRRISPSTQIAPDARFVIEDEQQVPGLNPKYLFGQGLHLITPLLWLLFALNLMGYFFLISWTPTLMTAAKLPPTTVALSGAVLQIGGTVGALLLCWWLQKHRFLAISIMFVLAVPIVASIGYAGLHSQGLLLIATFFAGFFVLGIQSGINVVGALIYPTSLRANGSGWELGIGRIGSIVGPLVGALFVGMSVEKLYVWSALPFAVGAVVCFAIYRLNERRLAKHPELRQAQ